MSDQLTSSHIISNKPMFALAVAGNLAFVALEVTFGVLAHSLVLLADAGHNAGDVVGLLLAWGASFLSRRKPTQRRTYGWRSTTILAALLNAVILLLAVGGILVEAVRRFGHPPMVVGQTIIWVALAGVMINFLTAMLFQKDRKKDLNIRGAFLHMAADAGVSAGVVVTGVLIQLTGALWIDPLVSLIIAVAILTSTWGLLRESVNLTLHAVPEGIDPQAIIDYLRALPGVSSVHDLHIWGMSTTETALTAHLVKPVAEDDDALLASISAELSHRFGIHHTTLQIEHAEKPCTHSEQCEPKE